MGVGEAPVEGSRAITLDALRKIVRAPAVVVMVEKPANRCPSDPGVELIPVQLGIGERKRLQHFPLNLVPHSIGKVPV